jgi:hypothetical protein
MNSHQLPKKKGLVADEIARNVIITASRRVRFPLVTSSSPAATRSPSPSKPES